MPKRRGCVPFHHGKVHWYSDCMRGARAVPRRVQTLAPVVHTPTKRPALSRPLPTTIHLANPQTGQGCPLAKGSSTSGMRKSPRQTASRDALTIRHPTQQPQLRVLQRTRSAYRRLLIHHMDRVQPSTQRLSPQVSDEVGAACSETSSKARGLFRRSFDAHLVLDEQ